MAGHLLLLLLREQAGSVGFVSGFVFHHEVEFPLGKISKVCYHHLSLQFRMRWKKMDFNSAGILRVAVFTPIFHPIILAIIVLENKKLEKCNMTNSKANPGMQNKSQVRTIDYLAFITGSVKWVRKTKTYLESIVTKVIRNKIKLNKGMMNDFSS